MGFEVVETPDLPKPGQFSQVVKKGNFVFISGQTAPKSANDGNLDPHDQAREIFDYLKSAIASAGGSMADICKAVIDSWDLNMLNKPFREMVDDGHFSREQLHAEIWEIVSGQKSGRENADERILIHTTGLVSQDVAIAHWIYQQAKARGMGTLLPLAHLQDAANGQ